MPWRNTRSPYFIWLSEVILQQTRVAQGLPYFEKFVAAFPDVFALAAAPEDEVLRLWQGLGYYSRARNLHRCAQEVVEKHHGEFPATAAALRRLPGIGPYTAAAIASFAFGEAAPVVDGNVYRVLARYLGIQEDISRPSTYKVFEQAARELMQGTDPGLFNQAIMEFGSLQCSPKDPGCMHCPLQAACYAFQHGQVTALPVKSGKVKVRERFFYYSFIRCAGQVLLSKRGAGDIWEGLYELPLREMEELPEEPLLPEGWNLPVQRLEFPEGTVKHLLSHQRLFARCVAIELEEKYLNSLREWAAPKSYLLVSECDVPKFGKPVLVSKFLELLKFPYL
ncbi:A/G-specific adenine glycosylase [Nitritalea halalkaliphila LW7]|uniref:Adenine DNA glycosylase n=1 Tax=Nitritalea halalkaliphila LW7 TaxID=1189621 RepID=I5C771_9BACT|nr:A/G-specific adenine glycosylase [Nitritalea halalkaliphila LW7]